MGNPPEDLKKQSKSIIIEKFIKSGQLEIFHPDNTYLEELLLIIRGFVNV